ncbi:MAG: T9SS type A sorting domain-containing protein [Bacteroidales bacterium]|nr:T9SS type A sorting domain-containing protein [Bacteroidales bacterium]
MKRSIKLIIIITSFAFAGNLFSQENITEKILNEVFENKTERYFKFNIDSKKEINSLTKIISIDNVINNEVFAYANRSEFKKFLKLNIDYSLLTSPGDLIKNPKMLSLQDYLNSDDIDDWDYYPTYEAYEAMMYQFETDYPDICKIVNIGILPSGRNLLIAKITDSLLANENEPEFLYTATMHGDETVGYILMLRLIDYYLSNYGVDTRLTNMINDNEIWINPLANPDGTYAGGNSSVYGATRYNANNVDLNRNYPDPEDGPHPDGNAWQPETLAFMDFAEDHHFVTSCNLHSGAEVCNYPWDTWYTRHADDDWWQYVCHEYADTAHVYSPYGYMSGYDNGITNGYDWYTISGGRQDYMSYFHQCREFTLELSNVKILPASQLNAHWEYNYRSLINYIEQVQYGIKGIITDSITGEPIKAEIFIDGHDIDSSMVFSSLPVGNYHRPIYGGSYDVTYSAPGYYSKTLTDVMVFNRGNSIQNIQLAPGSLIPDFTANQTNISTESTVDFTDLSYGNPIGWEWTFEGGIPTTSNEQHPSGILYSETGNFDVILTIYTESDTSTITKADYISVCLEYIMGNTSVTTCQGIFTDSGGQDGNYSDNEDYTMVFYPGNTDSMIKIEFTFFDIEYDNNCNYDWLKIYNGESTSAPLIGKYCGNNSPETVLASNSEGALTFEFHSDQDVNKAGWIANILCDSTVSITEIHNLDIIKVFPNPVTSRNIYIQSSETIQSVIIYNSSGQVIFEKKFNNKLLNIELPNCKSGIYMVNVKTDKQIFNRKLLVY